MIEAEFLGLETEQGRIEPFKVADLVVVRGHPLRDILALIEPVRMLLGGAVVVDRLEECTATGAGGEP